ncbi:MAG: hypothetical protein NC115_11450 [Bacteroidales bacterium]|nr:hypothetical protein [Bacteroides sp.]MCM1503262.1 hypothetical protein [Bacteroidales bacterium]
MPFADGEKITMDNISMSETKNIRIYRYLFENKSDDYCFVWFGQEDFRIYMFRPLFPLSIMTTVYEYGSTLVMDPDVVLTIPFITFYKVVGPSEKFTIYVYDDKDGFCAPLVEKSVQYISKKDTFLSENEHDFCKLMECGYKDDSVILNMESFKLQPVWVKNEGLKLMRIE